MSVYMCSFAVVELAHHGYESDGVVLVDADSGQVKTRVLLTVILIDLSQHHHQHHTIIEGFKVTYYQHDTIRYSFNKPLSECRAHTIKLQVKNKENIKMIVHNTEL